MSDYIKIFSPVIYFLVWLVFFGRERCLGKSVAAIFFASYVGCSQNFTLIYREIHQVLQFVMLCSWGVMSINRGVRISYNRAFFFLFVFILFSLVYNRVFDIDAKVQTFNILAIFGVFNYINFYISDRVFFNKLMAYFGLLGGVSSLVGILEFILVGGRIETTFSNPNYYGLFLAVAFCISWYFLLGWRKKITLFLIFVAIVFTGSRSTLIMPAACILFDSYLRKKYLKIALLSFISAIMFFSVLLLRSSESAESSDGERLMLAVVAMQMAQDNMLSGVGWGRFVTRFSDYAPYVDTLEVSAGVIDVSGQERRVTHNDFLRIFAELGVLAFIFSIYFAIKMLVRAYKLGDQGIGYLFPIVLGLILFSMAHNNMNTVFFWFFLMLPLQFTSKSYPHRFF